MATGSSNAADAEAQEEGARPGVLQAKGEKDATAEELAQAPEAFNMSEAEELNAANDKDNTDGGKIKALLNVLRRMIGVKDLAAIRLSLPANLLEPVPNLEYWNYMDRADLFTTVGDLDDPLDRMLACVRFAFCKELKFVHGKICKPYNSILGEHFRCHWDVQAPDLSDMSTIVPRMSLLTDKPTPMPLASTNASSGSSIRSASRFRRTAASSKDVSVDEPAEKGAGNALRAGNLSGTTTTAGAPQSASSEAGKTRRGLSRFLSATKTPKSSANSVHSSDSTSTSGKVTAGSGKPHVERNIEEEQSAHAADEDDASIAGSFKTSKSDVEARRVCFLTEQVSHHPPISSFFVACKDAGVELRGVDQLSAKFTGTNIKIYPGDQNKGIFLRLTEQARCGAADEEYQITHPTASINGMLRGSLWVSVQNTTYITCRGGKRAGDSGKRLRAITEYKDESWVMKAKYALEGAVYEYEYDEADPDTAEQITSIRDVPADRILLTYEGTWKGQVTYKLKGEKEARLLIDMNELDTIKNISVRPLEAQEEMESRRIWKDVTEAILGKEFGQATKHKQTIEQNQREAAAERKRNGKEFSPRFFDPDIEDGRPKLTEAGRAALDGEQNLEGYDCKSKDG